jgi:hypothetical protein
MERQAFVDAAVAVVGLGANPRHVENRTLYVRLIASGEPTAKTRDMIRMSGCALTVAGIWRTAGVVHTKLEPPYIIGTAVSRLISVARQADAWIPYNEELRPSPGDVVLVGDNKLGGSEHVFTVVESEGSNLESVDGGQLDLEGYQVIKRKKRLWKGQVDASYSGNMLSKGRKIIGWIDCTRLPGPVVSSSPCPA